MSTLPQKPPAFETHGAPWAAGASAFELSLGGVVAATPLSKAAGTSRKGSNWGAPQEMRQSRQFAERTVEGGSITSLHGEETYRHRPSAPAGSRLA